MDSEESDGDAGQSNDEASNGYVGEANNSASNPGERLRDNHGFNPEREIDNSQTQSPLIERSQKFKKINFTSQPSKIAF